MKRWNEGLFRSNRSGDCAKQCHIFTRNKKKKKKDIQGRQMRLRSFGERSMIAALETKVLFFFTREFDKRIFAARSVPEWMFLKYFYLEVVHFFASPETKLGLVTAKGCSLLQMLLFL